MQVSEIIDRLNVEMSDIFLTVFMRVLAAFGVVMIFLLFARLAFSYIKKI